MSAFLIWCELRLTVSTELTWTMYCNIVYSLDLWCRHLRSPSSVTPRQSGSFQDKNGFIASGVSLQSIYTDNQQALHHPLHEPPHLFLPPPYDLHELGPPHLLGAPAREQALGEVALRVRVLERDAVGERERRGGVPTHERGPLGHAVRRAHGAPAVHVVEEQPAVVVVQRQFASRSGGVRAMYRIM